jgi:hypothetical protein
MKPWIIERIEEQRRQQEWQPIPLHIQQPPPEWIEQRRRERESDRERSDRGVTIIDDSTTNRGVTIIEL